MKLGHPRHWHQSAHLCRPHLKIVWPTASLWPHAVLHIACSLVKASQRRGHACRSGNASGIQKERAGPVQPVSAARATLDQAHTRLTQLKRTDDDIVDQAELRVQLLQCLQAFSLLPRNSRCSVTIFIPGLGARVRLSCAEALRKPHDFATCVRLSVLAGMHKRGARSSSAI